MTANLGTDVTERHIYNSAKAYIKQKFTDWRSDEKRRIVYAVVYLTYYINVGIWTKTLYIQLILNIQPKNLPQGF